MLLSMWKYSLQSWTINNIYFFFESRYEFQKDESVLGEDRFPHDPIWLKKQIQVCLEFWLGEREASYTPEEERWKCRFCRYASVCPTNANLDSRTSSPTNSDTK